LLAISGSIAYANVYRFSSKEFHNNSGLYHYGFRFYDPTLQRWINRDPIFEAGGMNLYGFVFNSPVNYLDTDGRAVDIIVDIGSACWSAHDLWKNPSWGNAGFLAWDVAAAALPFVPGSYTAKAATKARKVDTASDALKAARKEFERMKPKAWMEEAAKHPDKYTPDQLVRMKRGKTPIGNDGYPMEIHHKKPLSVGGENCYDNFQFLTQTEHRRGDNFRINHPNLPPRE